MSADTGLVLSDNGRPLGLSGNVSFKANCYLPSGGIKPAFIEGQSYTGNGQNNAFIKKAPPHIPEIIDDYKKAIFEQVELVNDNDSMVFSLPNIFNRSFRSKTIVIESATNKLSGLRFSDNIKIVSQNELSVDSTCHFQNILIIAKKVRFKQGFKGSVHVIASDSIIVEKESYFEYPSSLVLALKEKKTSS